MSLSRTLADLEWSKLAEEIAKRCQTEEAKASASQLPMLPMTEARRQIEAIAQMRVIIIKEGTLSFDDLLSVDLPLARAQKGGTLSGPELLLVGRALRQVSLLRKKLRQFANKDSYLVDLINNLTELDSVYRPILSKINEEGKVCEDASRQLLDLHKTAARLRADLTNVAKEQMTEWASYLQDTYVTVREDRAVLPVRAEMRTWVPGIVHGSSQTGQTVFVEPTILVEKNNELQVALAAIRHEEERICRELSGYVAEDAKAIAQAIAAALDLDLVHGKARLADDLRAFPPEIIEVSHETEDAVAFDLRRARHPLLALSGRSCVANDIALDLGHALVISGPNAGGKTVALKTVGMAMLMAQAGLHIACGEGSVVAWFDNVVSDIGDGQSIERDLSTFSAHLTNLARTFACSGPRTLFLMDELCVGTEPEQGAALAEAVLESWSATKSSCVITTHYERLKVYAAKAPTAHNAAVGLSAQTMKPTFELHLDVPGNSGALMLAARMDWPESVLARANQLLGEGHSKVDTLIADLTQEKSHVQGLREELERALKQAEFSQSLAEETRQRLVEKERALHAGAHDEAVNALRGVRHKLDDVRKSLSRRTRRRQLISAKQKVDVVSQEVVERAPKPIDDKEKVPLEAVVQGADFFVLPLGEVGTVLELPTGNRVAMQVGGFRTMVKVGDLRKASAQAKKTNKKSYSLTEAQTSSQEGGDRVFVRTSDSSLDLRGQRVDDAFRQIDSFVDRSLRHEREILFIIHGHGTGVLRNAVREHVAQNPSIRSFRPGQPEEGGDGVTLLFLNL